MSIEKAVQKGLRGVFNFIGSIIKAIGTIVLVFSLGYFFALGASIGVASAIGFLQPQITVSQPQQKNSVQQDMYDEFHKKHRM